MVLKKKILKSWTVGVDLGGTKIAIGLVNANGEVAESFTIPTNAHEGPLAVVARMVEAIQKLCLRHPSKHILAVGVAAAGQIDSTKSIVLFAPNLEWREFPLAQLLKQKLKLPVFLFNDVKAATWAEWCCGAGKGVDDLVCIFVGTGIGGGIVANGKLLDGSNNSAGELGHMTVAMGGRKCPCGGRGCLEAMAGGVSIATNYYERCTEKSKDSPIDAREVCRLAAAGDAIAIQVIDDAIQALIAGTVTIANTLNPSRIIFGGGVIKGMPDWIKRIDTGMRGLALKTATEGLQILPAGLEVQAGVIGAALLASNSLTGNE